MNISGGIKYEDTGRSHQTIFLLRIQIWGCDSFCLEQQQQKNLQILKLYKLIDKY